MVAQLQEDRTYSLWNLNEKINKVQRRLVR